MPIGANPVKSDIDQRLYADVVDLKKLFYRMDQLWADAQRLGTAGLEDLGYTPGEAATVMSGLTDLASFRQIFRGQVGQNGTAPYDFLTFAGQFTGID